MANRVGVKVTRSTVGPLAFGPDPGDSFLIALLAERGPADVPTLVNSMTRFRRIFGGPTPNPQGASATKYSVGFEVLNAFLNKGGKQAYVMRLVGSGATKATVTIPDSSSSDTLDVTAVGPGSWANDYDIKISTGTQSGTFKLEVLDGNGDVVETWDNLTMDGADLARVNDGSVFVELADNSTSSNQPADGTYDLGSDTSGADDNDPSASEIVGSVNADGSKTGLKAFRSHNYGRGFIAAPDLDNDTTVIDELKAIGEAYYRFYLSSTDEGADLSSAQTQRDDHDAFNTGFYFPRAKVKDDETNGIKTIPVVGHVAADWQKAVQSDGPGKAPAGSDFEINFVRGLETQSNGQPWVDGPTGNAETLLGKGINPVYDRDGTGPKVWGARAATTEDAWKYMHAGYLYNRIASSIENALDQLTYENASDDNFFQNLKLGIRGFMVDLHNDDAFAGEIPPENKQPDPDVHAFAIQASEDLLSDQDKNNGIVRVKLWFKEALTAETIDVEVAKRVN